MNSKILVDFFLLIFYLAVTVGLTSGQALYGEIHDCKEDGSYCMKNIECCSEYCTDLTCGPCKETGSWCLFDSDCCSGICTYLTCRGCKTEWVACLTDEECCSNRYAGIICTNKTVISVDFYWA